MFVDRDELGRIKTTYLNEQYSGQEFVEGAVVYQEPATEIDPIDKLKAFLAANPDVAAILA